MGITWVYPDPRTGTWVLPVPPGKGRAGQPPACCCGNLALGGLLPLDPGCLLNPSVEPTNQPTPLGFKAEPQGENYGSGGHNSRASSTPWWRNRAAPRLPSESNLPFPSSPPFSLLLLSLLIHPDSTSTRAPLDGNTDFVLALRHCPCPKVLPIHSLSSLTQSIKYLRSSSSLPGSPLGSGDTIPALRGFTVHQDIQAG